TKREGRTILFVSHNMGAISSLCKKTILLECGQIIKYGETKETVAYYNNHLSSSGNKRLNKFNVSKDDTLAMQITKISLSDDSGNEITKIEIKNDIYANITYSINKTVMGSVVAILISKDEFPILYSYDTDIDDARTNRDIGEYQTRVKLPFSILKEGIYKISALVGHGSENMTDPNAFVYITLVNTMIDTNHKSYNEDRLGFLLQELDWQTKKTS
ncbi:MAG: hypothetical protein AABX11_01700, partial [Nanoarchaeota archaeon]